MIVRKCIISLYMEMAFRLRKLKCLHVKAASMVGIVVYKCVAVASWLKGIPHQYNNTMPGHGKSDFFSACISAIQSGGIPVFAALIACVVCISGCGGKKIPMMELVVTADKTANNGQPVYLLVRTVNSSDFVSEDYQSVAGMVMRNPPDKTVLSTNLILPGKKTEIKFTKPDNRSIGVYCMFTKPGQWKMFMQKPLKKKYKLILKKDDISMKKGFLKGWF